VPDLQEKATEFKNKLGEFVMYFFPLTIKFALFSFHERNPPGSVIWQAQHQANHPTSRVSNTKRLKIWSKIS
jgi:hypothetical protein